MNPTTANTYSQTISENGSPAIIHAFFDGKVFLPKEPLDLEPNTNWVLFVAKENLRCTSESGLHPFELIGRLATDLGPQDLSENFDRYTGRRME